jgi:hypothetical protein
VKVHCDEGVATHIGPKPCAGVREDVGEASAGLSLNGDVACMLEGYFVVRGHGGWDRTFRKWRITDDKQVQNRISSRSMNMIWLRFIASSLPPSQFRADLVISPPATMNT